MLVRHCRSCGGDGVDPAVKTDDGTVAKGEHAIQCDTCQGTGHEISESQDEDNHDCYWCDQPVDIYADAASDQPYYNNRDKAYIHPRCLREQIKTIEDTLHKLYEIRRPR